MLDNKYIERIKINSYDELVKIIQGKTDYCENLRDKFIFRGIENENFKLIPSALRNDNKLNNYVDEDFKKTLQVSYEHAVKHGYCFDEDKYIPGCICFISVDKEGKKIDGHYPYVFSVEEFQYRKEVNALMKFFDKGDKVGLKIPVSQDIRKLLDHSDKSEDKYIFYWPNPDYFELISLAQHYGVPTRALDWSYDYKVSLYFAVKNILNNSYLCNEKPKNAVLWAFNYKSIEIDYLLSKNNPFAIKHYRPEYNSNPNLNAQKGLFTFIMNDLTHISEEPFDKFVAEILSRADEFDVIDGKKAVEFPEGEKAFYKFIIPEEIKPEILNELYLEGYSEEYLFPGYLGVAKSIENRVNLDKLLLKRINCNKKNVLLVMDYNKIEKIKTGEKLYEFKKYNFSQEVDKIFIYSKEFKEVVGCFRGNKIFANTPLYFWKNFSEKAGLTKKELFDYFKQKGWGWAIKINDLRIFDNPIKLYNFKEPGNYCYIENRDELKFLLNFK